MTLLQRLRNSVRANGLGATLVKLWSFGTDWWFDFKYGVDTRTCFELSELTIASDSKERGHFYKPVRILPMRKFFKAIRPRLPTNAVLVDIGSGKGRILMVGVQCGFQKVRGVEFAQELCEIARTNSERFKARSGTSAELETIETDAAKYAIQPDENFFVLCNPFDDLILKVVLDNIAASIEKHPREVWIAYYNPEFEGVLQQERRFSPVEKFNFWGHHFSLYVSKRVAMVIVGALSFFSEMGEMDGIFDAFL